MTPAPDVTAPPLTATTVRLADVPPLPPRFGWFPGPALAVTVTPDAVRAGRTRGWLWPGWLPRGVAATLDPSRGHPADVAAEFLTLTTTTGWPDGQPCADRLGVLWLTWQPEPDPGRWNAFGTGRCTGAAWPASAADAAAVGADLVVADGPLGLGERDALLDLVAGGVTVIRSAWHPGWCPDWDPHASVRITRPSRDLLAALTLDNPQEGNPA
jgi:hypothetical protein